MTLEDSFSQRLGSDLTWRIRELTELVRACQDGTEARRLALTRAAVPLLYAHWEGYFVSSANSYLNFLSDKRIALSALRDEFWALSIRKSVRPNQINSDINLSRFLLKLRSTPDKTFRRGNFEKINGASNLKSDTLNFCCECIGIEAKWFEPYHDFIDEKLITKRNHIAHGEALRFSPQDIPVYRETVVELLRVTQTQFENAAHTAAYRRIA